MLGLKKSEYLGTNRRSFQAAGVTLVDTVYTERVFDGWHCHENAHITFVVEGGNREHRSSSETVASPGKLLFYHSHELHRNSNTSFPSKNLNVEIESAFMQQHGLTEATLAHGLNKRAGAAHVLLQMYKEALHADVFSADSIHMLLLDLATLSDAGSYKQPLWITRVAEYLQDHWSASPALHELALVAGVSPVTISKFFPRYLGCTLGEYMRRLKVERALGLVKQPGADLTAVAYACGFADQSHFTRVFKGQTGFLPRDYRRL